MPGPPAAEHAGPWESQHLCSSSAGGAGGGVRPPGPPPARPPPPAPGSFTERSEWNEWVPASSDARGNQMIRREGPPPQPGGRRPLRPERYRAGVWPDSASPPSPLPRGRARTASKGRALGARSRLRGGRAPARVALRGPVRVEGGGRTCGAGGPGNATRLAPPVAVCILGHRRRGSRWCERSVPGLGGEADRFAISHALLCALELGARGAESQRRIKGESVSPKRCSNVSPREGRGE